VITEQQNWTSDEMFARQKEITDPVLASADAQEGSAAFTEKRAPHWTGT
jgi:enoyl-CoA hydratase